MRLIVNPHKIELEKDEAVNELEINVSKCQFVFSDEITNSYVKEAYFTFKGESYKQIIVNNECDFPPEVLIEKGQVEIGVVAYLVENGEEIIRYNPSPVYFETWVGSLKNDAENSEPITPTDKEQMEQAIQDMETQIDNLDIDAEKVGKTTTITITKKDGTQEQVEVNDGEDGADGEGLDYDWSGTSLGVKKESEQVYVYTDLKGDKGDAGAIKMVVVNTLPATGADDTIYLAPSSDPSQQDIYEEYVYVNNAWEKIGGASATIDLTDYVKDTNYATASKGGVIKSGYYGLQVDGTNGKAYCDTYSYANYENVENQRFISKGTLENVITGKQLVNKTYVDGLVGDIDTALDAINGEVI